MVWSWVKDKPYVFFAVFLESRKAFAVGAHLEPTLRGLPVTRTFFDKLFEK